jgi:RNA polymerase sigma factor (sigma-70 family)
VRDHEKWVHQICQKYRGQLRHGNTYEDLHAVGMEGLAKAISKWDPAVANLTTFCLKPVTHAIWYWLKIEKRRGFTATGDTKTVPVAPPKVMHGHDPRGDNNDGDGFAVFDVIAGREAEPGVQWTEEQWSQVLSVLPSERYRQVIVGRFIEGKTLREVADDLGISRERVRQMEMSALDRIGRMVNLEF